MHDHNIFIAGPREEVLKIRAPLKERWDTREELRVLNRTLCCWRDGLAFAADVRHAKEVVDELALARSKLVTSPVVMDDASGIIADNQRLFDDAEKQLYQRIVAELNYVAHRSDLRYVASCLVSAASCSQPLRPACSETCWTVLEESSSDMAGIPFLRSQTWEMQN